LKQFWVQILGNGLIKHEFRLTLIGKLTLIDTKRVLEFPEISRRFSHCHHHQAASSHDIRVRAAANISVTSDDDRCLQRLLFILQHRLEIHLLANSQVDKK
jgi:hypothetical protein